MPIENGTILQNLQFCINIFILTKSDATMEIEFSWDEHKAETNLKKHGVAFEDATLVFYDACQRHSKIDPFYLTNGKVKLTPLISY